MRIVSGKLGGRRFGAPEGIRPTQERVREALFSSLGDRVEDARVLDLFAGSGAFGLEAWSRGAKEVRFVEKNGRVFQSLNSNLDALIPAEARPAVKAHRCSAERFLETWQGAAFDLVLADPPYRKALAQKTLSALSRTPMVAAGGLVVLETAADDPVRVEAPWRAVMERTYGDARITVIRRTEEIA
ncbi:16S rRNA (guanine(966)-N(2))-methyltransferase RsmD [Kiritimatiella glycovorans]|uniref:Ribosomal RNA small subunit methyltransferase D n=1 Tax=Kiritimatiella glycovorans TaxID=1307763 RepID=A0A0G3ELC4_9BACT|nr:16S rRNA (guanine(966)-N(2))-methyltransferase RsmD [Kiritimatiella glycovorans]AKJ65570.1 Ribosomal RNA small subunit methyltransferase D [Kiritimatiella glycovorans]